MGRIYVFDMGNVIIGEADTYKMYKMSKAECDYNTFYNLFYKSSFTKNVYEGIISDDEFFTIIKDKCGIKDSVDYLKRLYLCCKAKAYNDTLAIIRRLKEDGNMICLLSNLKKIDYEYLCSEIDIKMFNRQFLSYKMGQSKPDNVIYESVINELGTNRFYFFDDSSENVLSAQSCGIDAYQVTGNSIKECFQKKLNYRL